MNKINRIGIELEGGWDNAPDNFHSDSSVSDIDCEYVGETCSPLLKKINLKKWLKDNYPQDFNNTCGLHVHISLKNNLDYQKLMSSRFYSYLCGRYEIWAGYRLPDYHIFWDRFNGDNDFCQRKFMPDVQAQSEGKPSARYAQLNYCFRLHGTLECRLLPMFDSITLAYDAINIFLSSVEVYLTKMTKREKTIYVKIERD